LHILTVVALSALAVLVVTWLVVSFLAPSPRRRLLEWLAATAMYVALLAFFGRQLHTAIAGEAWIRTFAFGFLVAVFSIGFAISVVRTIRALLRPSGPSESGATH
jgi:hypothetical protein